MGHTFKIKRRIKDMKLKSDPEAEEHPDLFDDPEVQVIRDGRALPSRDPLSKMDTHPQNEYDRKKARTTGEHIEDVEVEGGNVGKEITQVSRERHRSEILGREADLIAAKSQFSPQAERQKARKEAKTPPVYKDEHGNIIESKQMDQYQTIVAEFYSKYVILTKENRDELRALLPKVINNLKIEVGPKAVFPHILDHKRKKVAAERVLSKMTRLKFLELETRRGLHTEMTPEEAEELYKKATSSATARKELIRTLISLNYNDFEICDYLNIKGTELSRIKKEVFFEEVSAVRQMSNEEMFAQYRMQQMEVVKDIDVLIERFKATNQLAALSNMLKNKADIYDKIIEKGQEFGIFNKAAEKHAIMVGNINISDAPIEKLEAELQRTNAEITKLVSKKNILLDPPADIVADEEEDS